MYERAIGSNTCDRIISQEGPFFQISNLVSKYVQFKIVLIMSVEQYVSDEQHMCQRTTCTNQSIISEVL